MKKIIPILFGIICFIILYFCLFYIINNINYETAKIALDYLKVFIWPLVILIIIIIFKSKFEELISRTEEIKSNFFGLKTRTSIEKQEEQKQISKQGQKDIIEDNKEDFKKIVIEKENKISELSLNNNELIKKLTNTQIELEFERIYNIIFAGQIILLNKLFYSYYKRISIIETQHCFQIEITAFPKELYGWTYEQYIFFLINQRLIEKDNDCIKITPKGEAFIKYLIFMNYKKYGL